MATSQPLDRRSWPPRAQLYLALTFIVLLCVALFVFWPATSGPFVFDDFPNLANLDRLDGSLDRAHLGQYLASFTGNPGRPLAALSFVMEDWAWPSDPFAFKRNNILWHMLAGVLVFAFSRVAARQRLDRSPRADWIAIVVAAMWLLHPMQLSATMLVVQRMNILSTIFVLGGLMAYLWCLQRETWRQTWRVAAAGVALGAFAVLAFLCKENGVLAFAYATALNLTLLRANIEKLAAFPRKLLLWGTAAPVLLLAAVAAASYRTILWAYRTRDFSLPERLLTEARVLVDYLQGILLPRIGGQGIFHDSYRISRGLVDPPATLACIAVLGALLVFAWMSRKKRPWFSFAILWFFAGHLIESSVWPLEIYFEHRNYLPMAGLLLGVVGGVAEVLRGSRMKLGISAAVLWLLVATALTSVSAPVWGNRDLLSAVWLKENPGSTRAVQMRASFLADSGATDAAREVLMQGYGVNPRASELAMQVALLDCSTRGLVPEQWEHVLSVARTAEDPRIIPVLVASFGREARGGRCHGTMPAGGFIALGVAATSNPAIRRRKQSLAYIYVELSRQAVHDRNLDQTMAFLDASYDARPDPLIARTQAIYLLSAGLPDAAVTYLRKSETATLPFFKAWLIDVPAMNMPLWRSARAQQRQMSTSHGR